MRNNRKVSRRKAQKMLQRYYESRLKRSILMRQAMRKSIMNHLSLSSKHIIVETEGIMPVENLAKYYGVSIKNDYCYNR